MDRFIKLYGWFLITVGIVGFIDVFIKAPDWFVIFTLSVCGIVFGYKIVNYDKTKSK